MRLKFTPSSSIPAMPKPGDAMVLDDNGYLDLASKYPGRDVYGVVLEPPGKDGSVLVDVRFKQQFYDLKKPDGIDAMRESIEANGGEGDG